MKGLFDSLSALDDLQALIDDGTRESEVLEYKTATSAFSDSEKREIAKDVTAMANSLGGVIIYGVSTSPTDKTLPQAIVPIEKKNIETFDRVLNAQIRPPIQGLRKKLIPTTDPKVLIVEVPPSEDPPHQTLYEKRYYRRSGSECLAMEHDLVALKFGRKLTPVLDLVFQPLVAPSAFSGEPPWSNEAHLRLLISNGGRRIGRHVRLLLRFPAAEAVRLSDRKGSLTNIDALYPGLQARQFSDDTGVFHPGMNTSVVELGMSFAESYPREKSEEPCIRSTLFADEMSPREGEVSLKDLGWLPAPRP